MKIKTRFYWLRPFVVTDEVAFHVRDVPQFRRMMRWHMQVYYWPELNVSVYWPKWYGWLGWLIARSVRLTITGLWRLNRCLFERWTPNLTVETKP